MRDEIVNYEYCVEAASSLIFRVSVRINQDSAPSAELGDFVVATNNILQLPPDEQGAKDWCGPDGDASCVSEVAKCGMNARSQLLRMLDVADAVKSDAATRFVKRLKGG